MWGVSEKCLGTIIPFTRGFSTVSATVILKLCCIASNWQYVWVVPSITRVPALTSKTHWFLCRKSLLITTGVPTSATSVSCVPIVSPQVPGPNSNCTRLKEPTTLPLVHPISPLFSFNGTFTLCDTSSNSEGWTTLTMDPVSSRPITETPLTCNKRCKLPISSRSRSMSALIGLWITSSACSWTSSASASSFPAVCLPEH